MLKEMAHLRPYLGTVLTFALLFLAWDASADALILPEAATQRASSEAPPESPVVLIAAPERAATLDAERRSALKDLLGREAPAGSVYHGVSNADRNLQAGAVFSPPPLHLRHCVFLC